MTIKQSQSNKKIRHINLHENPLKKKKRSWAEKEKFINVENWMIQQEFRIHLFKS